MRHLNGESQKDLDSRNTYPVLLRGTKEVSLASLGETNAYSHSLLPSVASLIPRYSLHRSLRAGASVVLPGDYSKHKAVVRPHEDDRSSGPSLVSRNGSFVPSPYTPQQGTRSYLPSTPIRIGAPNGSGATVPLLSQKDLNLSFTVGHLNGEGYRTAGSPNAPKPETHVWQSDPYVCLLARGTKWTGSSVTP